MNAEIFALARKHLGKGPMDSSARLCLSDAIKYEGSGGYAAARRSALRSLAYSVGIAHEDYAKAYRLAYGDAPPSLKGA